jgi:hypothetical protein
MVSYHPLRHQFSCSAVRDKVNERNMMTQSSTGTAKGVYRVSKTTTSIIILLSMMKKHNYINLKTFNNFCLAFAVLHVQA